MLREHPNDRHVPVESALAALPSVDGPEAVRGHRFPAEGRPRLRARLIERTALIGFENAEFLFDEEVIRSLGEQLDRLIKVERYAHLIINLGGVRHLSSEVLGKLAWLAKQIEPGRGRISLCGLDPLLRDMLRITHLDRVFDVHGDEAQALGLIIRGQAGGHDPSFSVERRDQQTVGDRDSESRGCTAPT
jgi:anti-anti-sigma factor